jgi:hypothetical protein
MCIHWFIFLIQLAVLATYEDKECIAIYHYCRSILVHQPFNGGFDNLTILFSKNKTAVDQLTAAGRDNMGDKSNLGRKHQDLVKTKTFLAKFSRCHGMLFELSSKMMAAVSKSSDGNSSSSSGGSGEIASLINSNFIDTFDVLLSDTLEAFDGQLVSAALGDPVLVRLLAICLFSVHYASNANPRSGHPSKYGGPLPASATTESVQRESSESSNHGLQAAQPMSLLNWNTPLASLHQVAQLRPSNSGGNRTISESLALKLLFGFINRCVYSYRLMCTPNDFILWFACFSLIHCPCSLILCSVLCVFY